MFHRQSWGVFDVFKHQFGRLHNEGSRPNENMSDIQPHNVITTSKRHRNRVDKGGIVPIDSVRRFTALLSQAAANFHSEVLDILKDVISKSDHTFEGKLGVKKSGNLEFRSQPICNISHLRSSIQTMDYITFLWHSNVSKLTFLVLMVTLVTVTCCKRFHWIRNFLIPLAGNSWRSSKMMSLLMRIHPAILSNALPLIFRRSHKHLKMRYLNSKNRFVSFKKRVTFPNKRHFQRKEIRGNHPITSEWFSFFTSFTRLWWCCIGVVVWHERDGATHSTVSNEFVSVFSAQFRRFKVARFSVSALLVRCWLRQCFCMDHGSDPNKCPQTSGTGGLCNW